MKTSALALALLCLAMTSGCSTVCKFVSCQGTITTTTNINGTTTTRTAEFSDWDEFRQAWSASFSDWHETRDQMMHAYGEQAETAVTLADVDPQLAPLHEQGLDFVSEAATDGGRSMFSYVRTGRPEVDAFFAEAARAHALSGQATQTAEELRAESLAVLGEPDDRAEALPKLVERALKLAPDHGRIGQLKQAAELIARVAPKVRRGVKSLRSQGEALADAEEGSGQKAALVARGLERNAALLGKSDEVLDVAQQVFGAL